MAPCVNSIQSNLFYIPPLYAKTNRPIIVPIEYLRCVEVGATKCTHGHTFNLLYRDSIADKLDNYEPSQEETQILNHLLAFHPHCNFDLYPCAIAACLARDQEFLAFFSAIQTTGPRNLSSSTVRRPQTYNTLRAHSPEKT